MAYTTATIVLKDPPLPDGRVQITVAFTGNAGEPAMRRQIHVGPDDTGQSLRRWAIAQAKSLGDVKTIADSLTVGQSINLTPIATPPATAEEVWRAKVARYQRMAGLGLTGQAATDLAALKADIEATYITAYL